MRYTSRFAALSRSLLGLVVFVALQPALAVVPAHAHHRVRAKKPAPAYPVARVRKPQPLPQDPDQPQDQGQDQGQDPDQAQDQDQAQPQVQPQVADIALAQAQVQPQAQPELPSPQLQVPVVQVPVVQAQAPVQPVPGPVADGGAFYLAQPTRLMPAAASPGFIADPTIFKLGYVWKNCERDNDNDSTQPFDDQGNFLPQCAPDTLYTWQKGSTVQQYIDTASSSQDQSLAIDHITFFWRTPLGTFGYGNRQLRLKLKKDVQFKLVNEDDRGCDEGNPEIKNTVYVSHLEFLGRWTEYYLCSGGPIESWSTGTAEAYQEMLAEKSWVETHQPSDYDQILPRNNYACQAGAEQCALYGSTIADPYNDWSVPHLLSNLSRAESSIASDRVGQIFYSPGVPHDEMKHFQTTYPNYFNPVAVP